MNQRAEITSDDDFSVLSNGIVYISSDSEDVYELSDSYCEPKQIKAPRSKPNYPSTPRSSPPTKKYDIEEERISQLAHDLKRFSENEKITMAINLICNSEEYIPITVVKPVSPDNIVVSGYSLEYRDKSKLSLEEAKRNNRILAWLPKQVVCFDQIRYMWYHQLACLLFWMFNHQSPFLGETTEETTRNIIENNINVEFDRYAASFPVQLVLWNYLNENKIFGQQKDIVNMIQQVGDMYEPERVRRTRELWALWDKVQQKLRSFDGTKCVCNKADTLLNALNNSCTHCYNRLVNSHLHADIAYLTSPQLMFQLSENGVYILINSLRNKLPVIDFTLPCCHELALSLNNPELGLFAYVMSGFELYDIPFYCGKNYLWRKRLRGMYSEFWEQQTHVQNEERFEQLIQSYSHAGQEEIQEASAMYLNNRFYSSNVNLEYLRFFLTDCANVSRNYASHGGYIDRIEPITYAIRGQRINVIKKLLSIDYHSHMHRHAIEWRPEKLKWDTYKLLVPYVLKWKDNWLEQDCVLFCVTGNLDVAMHIMGLPEFDASAFVTKLFVAEVGPDNVELVRWAVAQLKDPQTAFKLTLSDYMKWQPCPQTEELCFQFVQSRNFCFVDKSPQYFLWEHVTYYLQHCETYEMRAHYLNSLRLMIKYTDIVQALQTTSLCEAVLRGAGKQLCGDANALNRPDNNGVLPIWYAARLNNRDAVAAIMRHGISKAVWVGALRIALHYQCPDVTRALTTFFRAVDLQDESLPEGAHHPMGCEWLVDTPKFKFMLNSYDFTYAQRLLEKLGVEFKDVESFSNRYTFRHLWNMFQPEEYLGKSKMETDTFRNHGLASVNQLFTNELGFAQNLDLGTPSCNIHPGPLTNHLERCPQNFKSVSLERFRRMMPETYGTLLVRFANILYLRDIALENVMSNKGKRTPEFVFNGSPAFKRAVAFKRRFDMQVVKQSPLPPQPHQSPLLYSLWDKRQRIKRKLQVSQLCIQLNWAYLLSVCTEQDK